MLSAGTPDILAEDFPDFCRFLQADSNVGARLGFGHFPPNNIQFIIRRRAIRHYIIAVLKMSLNNKARVREEQVSV
jgi:hypothetical protein